MIINSLDNGKIKIIIDEIDLQKAEIPIQNWIVSSTYTLLYIEKLLNFSKQNKIKKDMFPVQETISIKDYTIFTYNYKIFLITINLL